LAQSVLYMLFPYVSGFQNVLSDLFSMSGWDFTDGNVRVTRYIIRDVTKYIGNPPLVVEKSENVAYFCTPVCFLEKILISLFKDIDKFYASKPNLVSMWPPNGPKIHWSAKIGFISHKGGFPTQYNIFSDIPWYPPLHFLP